MQYQVLHFQTCSQHRKVFSFALVMFWYDQNRNLYIMLVSHHSRPYTYFLFHSAPKKSEQNIAKWGLLVLLSLGWLGLSWQALFPPWRSAHSFPLLFLLSVVSDTTSVTFDLFSALDYRLFCIALAQRYVPPPKGLISDVFDLFFDEKGPKFISHADFNKLPEEEKKKMRREIMDIHDRMLEVFKSIPSDLMLIFR